jgi:thymidylate synthase (FAD)
MSIRPHNAALDALIGKEIPVLDHGFVRVVDYMGDDSSVVQAARVSYGSGTKGVRDDRALIRYLLSHAHTTPFEMAEIKLHVKLPIFVARQWIRHRTASVNEYSARYSIIEDQSYAPDDIALASQSTSNRQGRGDALNAQAGDKARAIMEQGARRSYADYRALLNEMENGSPIDPEGVGLARELARSVLPVSFYSQWYWKIDLHNLMHFLKLRMDSHAQWEIRQYANVIGDIVANWVPVTWDAFKDYRLESTSLSGPAYRVLAAWLKGEDITFESSGLSKREWEELHVTFQR